MFYFKFGEVAGKCQLDSERSLEDRCDTSATVLCSTSARYFECEFRPSGS